ncbi:hypothetical protein F4781DRAFT_419062 [Annulohypoxylon bovei var. microspora]|nr:hypothetical protein F4781DRAFT_419062 [Annulohypoxylon bovei var. microspora]
MYGRAAWDPVASLIFLLLVPRCLPPVAAVASTTTIARTAAFTAISLVPVVIIDDISLPAPLLLAMSNLFLRM